MGALGERFRQARIDRHVTLDDAQRETRIHRRFLEALENEDLGTLPAPVYARGFVRTYAEYLNLDPDMMADLFLSMRGPEAPTVVQPATTISTPPRPLPIQFLGYATAAIVALLLLGYMWSQYNSFVESVRQADATPTPRVTAFALGSPAPSPVLLGPSASPDPLGSRPSVLSSPTPVPAPTPIRGIQVEVRATERTWLAAWVDNQQVMAEEVQSGFTRTFNANQAVRLRVGNAAALSVVVNGATQGALGARGQVIDASWGR